MANSLSTSIMANRYLVEAVELPYSMMLHYSDIASIHIMVLKVRYPHKGRQVQYWGIVPNTAFIFRVFVVTPRTLSYLGIFSSLYLALILHIQVVNSPSYSITWIFPSKTLTDDDLSLKR